jgi:DNA-binding NtrC family response regulator
MGRHAGVLIVDDEEDLCLALSDYLNSVGIPALTATSGVEGLGMLRDHSPAMMLVDIKMPGRFDGPRLAELATAMDHKVKVVLMSADAEAVRHAREDQGHGAITVLDKTLEPSQVKAVIEAILPLS